MFPKTASPFPFGSLTAPQSLSLSPRGAPRRPTPGGATGGDGGKRPALTARPKIPPAELTRLRLQTGLTVPEVLALAGITRRTWDRWQHTGAPLWMAALLRLHGGFLDPYGWAGWRLHRGRLVSMEWSIEIRPQDLYSWWFDRQK